MTSRHRTARQCVFLLAAIAFTALFVGITREGIVDRLPTPEQVRAARLRFGLGVGVYSAAFLLSWLSPALALAAHGAMAAYYLTEQPSRLIAPAQSDPGTERGS